MIMALIPSKAWAGIAALTLAAAVLSSSASRATVITFDAVPITNVTSYSEAGVTFTALDGGRMSAVPDPNGTNGLISLSTPLSEFEGGTAIGSITGFS
jgi:hypothetical protein